MLQLSSPITEISGVGAATAKNLSKLGIKAVSDLLFYYPYKHLDFSVYSQIKNIHAGETITIKGIIKSIASRYSFKSRLALCEAIISDETGSIKVTWFNQSYIKNYLHPGDEVLLSGKTQFYKQLQLINPIYEKLSDDPTHTGRIVPVYHLTENVYNKSIRNLIKQNLELAEQLEDQVPSTILKKFKLLSLPEAIKQVHFPQDSALLEQAKLRITFDDIFIKQLGIIQRTYELSHHIAYQIESDIELVKNFLSTLPFELTAGQKQAAWQIMQDLSTGKPMNRLLEGDVGSGKTLVAVLSMLAVLKQGLQVSLLAPTEILAQQHYETISNLLQKSFPSKKKLSIGLLTSHYHLINNKPVAKKQLLEEIVSGEVNLLVGTHALLFGVEFSKLALTIVDEQHRFGVQQRAALLKTDTNKPVPHLLSMTATPIPRTLALALYSNLEISTLKTIPKNRKPIETKVVPEDGRSEVYKFIEQQVTYGRQIFIITPRVEETGAALTKSVKAEFKRLQSEIFPNLKLGLLHGKLKPSEKDKSMQDFYDGKINILVATSVIEIGIDVPNATCMIIEGAQNFGLAQLHQLRGRVGRGEHQSYCFLFSDSSDEKTLSRLQFFASCTDGFKLAETDLQQRGFGDLFGDDQTGFDFAFSRFITLKTLETAKQAASDLLKADPELKNYLNLREAVAKISRDIHSE